MNLRIQDFPTIDPKIHINLQKKKKILMEKLKSSFINSEKLQKHITFLICKGKYVFKI